MPIPFKFDSCNNFATNLNTASSLGLGSKKCSKHFTLVNNIPSSFFIIIFLVNIKKEIHQENKTMQARTGQAKKHKTHWKILMSFPGIEPGASGVVLQCAKQSPIQLFSYKCNNWVFAL